MNKKVFSKTINIIVKLSLLTLLLFLLFSCGGSLVSPDINIPPDNLTLDKIAEGQIELSWTYNAGSDTVMYHIAKKVGTSGWINPYGMTENKFFQDFIPTSDTLVYSYQITAHNISTGIQSSPSEIVAYFSEYSYPSDLKITQIAQDQLEISWQDHSLGEEGFYVDRKIGEENWVNKYRSLGENTTSFTDFADLYEDVIYRVKAFSGITNTPTITDTIFPTLLAPSNLILAKPDNQQIRITWQNNSASAEGFFIDKKIGESDWISDYVYVDSPINTYIDDIELPCGDFYYRVRAVEGIYTSPYSEEEKITIFLDLISSTPTSGNPLDIFISEETNWYALIADLYSGFALIDCVNPSAPQNQNYNEEGLPDRTISVAVKNNMAYVTTLSGLEEHGRLFVVDLSPILPYHGIEFPGVLQIAANVPVSGNPDDTYVPYDIYIEGDYAYIADGANGLEIIYIATSNPEHVANIQTGGIARRVYVNESYAYVSTGFNGVVVIDITDPNNPIEVEHYTTSGFSLDATERDGYVFVADGENGLKIVNSATGEINYISTGGFANGVYVQGQGLLLEDHVYLLDREKGLYVIDISDISNPYILGYHEMDSEPVSIAKFFFSSYVFIADSEGLKIIQVAP
jgi:hypothetical protein